MRCPPAEHDNWISTSEAGGLFCISIIRDEQAFGNRPFYRLLIRSIFGTRSVILFEDDLLRLPAHRQRGSAALFSPSSTTKRRQKVKTEAILQAALGLFMESEREKYATLEDDFGALSIRTACTTASAASAASLDLVRLLPSSRMRDASLVLASQTQYSQALPCRTPSNRSARASSAPPSPTKSNGGGGGDDADDGPHHQGLGGGPIGQEGGVSELTSGMVRKKFKELARRSLYDLVKTFTKVKEGDLCQSLLELERANEAKVAHVDILLCTYDAASGRQPAEAGDDEEAKRARPPSWQAFEHLLGDRLTKKAFREQSIFLSKNGRVPSALMSELIRERRRTIGPLSLQPAGTARGATDAATKERQRVAEFVLNEAKYVEKLAFISETFLEPLDPSRAASDGGGGDRTLMGRETFKKVFEGFPAFLALHRRFLEAITGGTALEAPVDGAAIARRVEEGAISAEAIARALLALCANKDLLVYANFFDDYPERVELLRRLAEVKAPFAQYLEEACRDVRANRCTLDQLMGNMFQHPPRYALQLKGLIETIPKDSPTRALLLEAHEQVDDVVGYLELVKERREETTQLFKLQRRIANSPPDMCRMKRMLITKMAAYEVERGETVFSKRLTLFLFNDMLIGARKRRSLSGKLTSRDSAERGLMQAGGGGGAGASTGGGSSIPAATHDFLFMAPVGSIVIKRLDVRARTRKVSVTTFSIELPLESTVIMHEGALVRLGERAIKHPECLACSSYRLVAKKQEKLSLFLEKFNETKHQSFLADSTADIYVKGVEGTDKMVYFHVFSDEQEYLQWRHKSKVAILYVEQGSKMPTIDELYALFPENETDALMVVQTMNGSAFRMNIKSRDLIFASTDAYRPSRDFVSWAKLEASFMGALLNCSTLQTIYPPFGPQVALSQRQQLEKYIRPYATGLFRSLLTMVKSLKKEPTRQAASPGDDHEGDEEEDSMIGSDDDIGAREVGGMALGQPLGESSRQLSSALERDRVVFDRQTSPHDPASTPRALSASSRHAGDSESPSRASSTVFGKMMSRLKTPASSPLQRNRLADE